MKCRKFMVRNGDYFVEMTNYYCADCNVEMDHVWPIVFDKDNAYCYNCAFKKGIISEESYVKTGCSAFYGGNTKVIGAYVDECGDIVIWDKRRKDPRIKTTKDYRHNNQYQEWRTSVFKRDNFTCAICGQVGGELNAHHIKPFKKYKKDRYNIDNGITLCVKCHRNVHKEKDKKWLYVEVE